MTATTIHPFRHSCPFAFHSYDKRITLIHYKWRKDQQTTKFKFMGSGITKILFRRLCRLSFSSIIPLFHHHRNLITSVWSVLFDQSTIIVQPVHLLHPTLLQPVQTSFINEHHVIPIRILISLLDYFILDHMAI